MKRMFSLKVFIFIIAVAILTVSIVTLVHADKLDDCHKFCANKYKTSFRLYTACMEGCIFAANK